MTSAAPATQDDFTDRVVVQSINSQAASGPLFSPGGTLAGWSLTEDTGAAPAVARLIDGSGLSGSLIAKISLAAGASSVVRPGVGGWPFGVGLFLQIDSGTLAGSVAIERDKS